MKVENFDEIKPILQKWKEEAIPKATFINRWYNDVMMVSIRDNILRVYTNDPGLFVGKAGTLLNKYKEKLLPLLPNCTDVLVFEVRQGIISNIE